MKDTQLRYALSAWKELSFTGAAEQLSISQSAISQQVSMLESELGFQLFDRVGNGIRPTYKGILFLGHADEALTGMAQLSDIAQQLKGEFKNFISLGFSSNVTDMLLQAIVNEVKTTFPDSNLKIVTGTTRRIQRMTFEGRIDIGFSFDVERDLAPPNLEIKKYLDAELLLAVPLTHRLANLNEPIDLHELQKEPLIVNEPNIGLGKSIERFLSAADISPQITAISDNIHSSVLLVQSGVGVTFVPSVKDGPEPTLAGVELKRLKSDFMLPIMSVRCQRAAPETRKSTLDIIDQIF